MPRYDDDDVSFETPDDWEDRSMAAHVGEPDESGGAPTIVVTREPLKEGETLSAYRDRQLVDLARELPEFEVYESKNASVGGRPAIILRYTLKTPDMLVEQTLTMVEALSPEKKPIAITFAASLPASPPQELRDKVAEVMRTVRFGPSSGGEPPPIAPPPTAPPPPADPGFGVPYVPMPGSRRK